jgi:uncharacterized protein
MRSSTPSMVSRDCDVASAMVCNGTANRMRVQLFKEEVRSVAGMMFRPRILLALAIAWIIGTIAAFGESSDALLGRLQPQGYVSDFASVLNSSESGSLESFLHDLEQKTGSQVAVVTVQSLEGGEIDDFTNRLFEKWKIGKKGKDNGVLILAAIQDHKARIEVGYGLESVIPDAEAGRILREQMFPQFKQGRYGAGLMLAVQAVANALAHNSGVELPALAGSQEVAHTNTANNQIPWGSVLLYTIIAIWIIGSIIMRARRGGGGYGYWYGGGGFGGGSSGSGFSGGGGFGGFGGGGSGGGGASGSW